MAELTDVRAFGGVVLLAGGALWVVLVLPVAGDVRAAIGVVVALALFAASHPLGDELGAWPAVFVAAALVACVSAVLTRGRA